MPDSCDIAKHLGNYKIKNNNIEYLQSSSKNNREFACQLQSKKNLEKFIKGSKVQSKHSTNTSPLRVLGRLFRTTRHYKRENFNNTRGILLRRDAYVKQIKDGVPNPQNSPSVHLKQLRENLKKKYIIDNTRLKETELDQLTISSNILDKQKNIKENNKIPFNKFYKLKDGELLRLKGIITKYSEIVKYMKTNNISFDKESEPKLYHTIDSLKKYEAQKQYRELTELIKKFKSDVDFANLYNNYSQFKHDIVKRYTNMMKKLIEKYWPPTRGNNFEEQVLTLHHNYTLIATQYISNEIIVLTETDAIRKAKSSSSLNNPILVFKEKNLKELDKELVSIYIINVSFWPTNNPHHYDF